MQQTVNAILSCGHTQTVHPASSLFDYPECRECVEAVTVAEVRCPCGHAAHVERGWDLVCEACDEVCYHDCSDGDRPCDSCLEGYAE